MDKLQSSFKVFKFQGRIVDSNFLFLLYFLLPQGLLLVTCYRDHPPAILVK